MKIVNAILEKRFAALIAHRGTVAKLSTMAVLVAFSIAWPGVASSQERKLEEIRKPEETSQQEEIRKQEETRKPTADELETWRKTIVHTRREKKEACYKASYPDTAWHEVPCVSIPRKAYPPRVARGAHTFQVGGGGGTDFSATTTNGITEAEGSFDSVTTSGETNVPTSGPNTSESYTLQLNTAPFSTSSCSGAPGTGISGLPGCQGWVQFVYSTDNSGDIGVQYWLLQWGKVGATCKAPVSTHCDGSHVFSDGWCPFTLTDNVGDKFTDCAIDGQLVTGIGDVNVSSLKNIVLTAFPADAANTNDNMTATISGSANNAPGNNSFPDLATSWKEVEFNIFGDGSDGQAKFNANTTLEVRTSANSGTTSGPGCDLQSFTGETNNLTLVSTTSNPPKGNLPSLVFTETNVGSPATVPCSSAISLGDTHIHPFNGETEYDFQAFGDFLLVEAGPNFMVHTRQVPGPPGYPGTSTNTAVAVMMGRTRVAVYL